MNTANLQLEGLLLALAQILDALARAGVLPRAEIDAALARAEGAAAREGEGRNISPAQVEALLFPIRVLRLAAQAEGSARTFGDLASDVGTRKDARPETW